MKQIIIIILVYTLPLSIIGQNSDSLNYYIEFAIKNNPELQSQYKAYEASLEKVPQYKSLADPTLSFGYFINPVETRLGPQMAKISVSQMFPWFGTLDAKGKQAAFLAKAKLEQYNSSVNKIVYLLKKEYFKIIYIRKSIDYVLKQIDLIDMLEKQALIKTETGQTSIVDVLQFQMEKEELMNKVKNLRTKDLEMSGHFNLILNTDKMSKIIVPDSLNLITHKEFSIDSVMLNNPKIKYSEHIINYSEKLVKESKLSSYPKFGLGLDYVFVGKRQDINTENNGKDVIMPMLSMTIPINRKKNKAKIKESELKSEEFKFKKEAVENELISEFETGISKYQSALNDLNLYEDLIIKSEQVLRILRTAYENSGKDYDQLLNMQRKVLNYHIKKLEAGMNVKIAESFFEYLSNN